MTSNSDNFLSPIIEVIADYRAGKMVIIVDDDNRENEGDLAIATEHVTAAMLSFMMREARGLICVSIDQAVAERLKLLPQVDNNNSRYGTPFTATIDHSSLAHAGVTARGRALTMTKLLDSKCDSLDFVTPGHVYPLVANPAGVLARRGQTEGAYDLARLAGLKPSGVICEILNPDGTMARGDDLIAFAKKHELKITSIESIVGHIIANEIIVREVTSSDRQTMYGKFRVSVFENDVDRKEHLALTYGLDDQSNKTPLVRVHSECLTGDVFGSRRCDCGSQLSTSMNKIVEHGKGALLYLRQEGRGIGLVNKLKAYELQDQGRDTVEANLELGFGADERDFAVAAKMLTALGIDKIKLLTNNPNKLSSMNQLGIEVTERIPLVSPANEYNQRYLDVKRTKLGHLI